MQPKLIIHGGAGNLPKKDVEQKKRAIADIHQKSFEYLKKHSALEAVSFAVTLLEDCPYFNAGTGSKLQSDGVARMSASIMDGKTQTFSAVLNIEKVRNPIQVAFLLRTEKDRILAGNYATQFARSHGFLEYDPVTETSLKEWQEKSNGSPMGTVGAVALDAKGRLASATSTGGKGFERVGRVSDTPMPAGNYANRYAAVSCTGIGEDIIDESMASKIVLRVTDGMTLAAAFKKSFKEAKALKHEIGAIGIDYKGNVVFQHTTPFMWKSC